MTCRLHTIIADSRPAHSDGDYEYQVTVLYPDGSARGNWFIAASPELAIDLAADYYGIDDYAVKIH